VALTEALTKIELRPVFFNSLSENEASKPRLSLYLYGIESRIELP
jgi:hypothetical protein